MNILIENIENGTSDCYWHDPDDPLAQKHGRIKYRELEREYLILLYRYMIETDKMPDTEYKRLVTQWGSSSSSTTKEDIVAAERAVQRGIDSYPGTK